MRQNKPVIGITGTIAAGKSTVSRYFRDAYRIPILDADVVGHEVLLEDGVKQELTKAFGSDILNADQKQVDRRKLGKIVFTDAKALHRLNSITHPVICIRIDEAIAKTQEAEPEAPFLLVEAIELLRSPLKDMVQEVWAVCADPQVRIRRIMKRQNLTEAEAVARVQSQWSDEEYSRRAAVVFDGGGDTPALYAQCDRVYARMMERGEGEGHG